MPTLGNGRKILFSRNIGLEDIDFSTENMLDASIWAWAGLAKSQKEFEDDKKREAWWKAQSVDARKRMRATFIAITKEGPKNATKEEQVKWWQELGKDKRVDLRDKYDGDDFIDSVKKVAGKALDFITLTPIVSKIPVLGDIHKSIHGAVTKLNMLPFKAAEDLVNGKRIDKIALSQFKEGLSAAKTLAPYVQTVISFVPGIGTGLSAGIGGALALASGKNIDEAMIEAVKSALPGGAIAEAVFDVTTAIIQKKPIEQVLINVIPVSDEVKEALVIGTKAVRDLAEGKKVDQILVDNALKALPKDLQKAAQVGVSLAQAAKIQKTADKKPPSLPKEAKKPSAALATKKSSTTKPKEVLQKAATVVKKISAKPVISTQTQKDLNSIVEILNNRKLQRLATIEHKTIVNQDEKFNKIYKKLEAIEAKI